MNKFKSLWYCIKPYFKRIGIIGLVTLILISGWKGLIFLTGDPPLSDIWPALIMVWLSIFVLILAVFPQLFDKIKKVRIKDLEIILEKVLKDSPQREILSFSEYKIEQVEFEEGNFKNLKNLIKKSILEPDQPLIIVANLSNNIPLSLIFTYLFLLSFVSPSVVVLFISARSNSESEDIIPENVIGAITGKDMLSTFYQLFPDLLNLFNLFNKQGKVSDVFHSGKFKDFSFARFSQKADEILSRVEFESSDYLTKTDIRRWYGNKICSEIIDLSLDNVNYRKIFKALKNNDDYLIISENNKVKTMVSVTDIAKNISLKTLENFYEQ
ncbi:MAG: hypothetical protein ACOCQS_01995 [Bacillota bacterium]